MKKALNTLAKAGMEIVMYLFEHLFFVIGIIIILVLVISRLQAKKIKKNKKGVALYKTNWYIENEKWISNRTKKRAQCLF